MTLQNVQSIIDFLLFLLAYTIAVTLGGAFKAWTADKMGDDTAESLGFTSLNPVTHIDPIGLLCFYAL